MIEAKVTAARRPLDYRNEKDRGTLQYDPAWRNYSFHRVEIPAGTVVRGGNFSQVDPNNTAIITDGPITLIDCNLVNCAIDKAWTVEGCNTAQVWFTKQVDSEETSFIAASADEIKGDERPPLGVITKDSEAAP